MKISVVISVFNEENNIKTCIESAKDFADEIIVIDNSSEDKTFEIAKKYADKVFQQKNDPQKIDFQKNFGFSKATGDWIFSLDADERITPELANEIRSIVKGQTSNVNAYWIPRKNLIFGKWIKSDMWWPDYQLKIFRKGKGSFEKDDVHKALRVEGETEKLKNPLTHNNYQTISQYINKLNNYTDIEARDLLSKGYEFNWLDSIRFPIDDFVKTFFLQKGYKDGLHGLVLSVLQAFYMEVVFAKIWEKKDFVQIDGDEFGKKIKKEFKTSKSKIKYWIMTSVINDSKNPVKKIWHKINRKITSKDLPS